MVSSSGPLDVDEAAAFDLIGERSFGLLVTIADGAPVATFAPMLVDRERRALQGHVARGNPQADLIDGNPCLAAFTGPNAYISPNWYLDPTNVPTWNYLAVQIEGRGRVIAAPADVDALLAALSRHHESRRHDLGEDRPWTMDKMPAGKLDRLRRGIVAFEIGIEKLTFKRKLGDNKTAEDVAAVAAKLSAGDADQRAVAQLMLAAKGAS